MKSIRRLLKNFTRVLKQLTPIMFQQNGCVHGFSRYLLMSELVSSIMSTGVLVSAIYNERFLLYPL